MNKLIFLLLFLFSAFAQAHCPTPLKGASLKKAKRELSFLLNPKQTPIYKGLPDVPFPVRDFMGFYQQKKVVLALVRFRESTKDSEYFVQFYQWDQKSKKSRPLSLNPEGTGPLERAFGAKILPHENCERKRPRLKVVYLPCTDCDEVKNVEATLAFDLKTRQWAFE